MWFKNLTLFQLTEPFPYDATTLAAKLQAAPFRPCLSQELQTHGWVSPTGQQQGELVHAVGPFLLVCLKSEEKILPAAVVNELLAEKIEEIEEREARAVRRKEKDRLRDEIMQELLPRAFTRSRLHYAYLDTRGGWLVVNSSSRKAVELLTGMLRKTLGSLPIVPPKVAAAPAAVMTGWLKDGAPAGVELADECELRDSGEGGGVVRCKRQDLRSEEIDAHLLAGKQVTRLALHWDGRLSVVLGDDLSVRRLRFADVVQEQLDDVEAADEQSLFDAQFALMTGELGEFLPRLLALF